MPPPPVPAKKRPARSFQTTQFVVGAPFGFGVLGFGT